MATGARKSYTIVPLEQKILAVEIAQRMGGRVTDSVMNEVRKALNLPTLHATNLRKWMWQYGDVKRPSLPTTDRGRITVVREVTREEDGKLVMFSERDRKEVVINEKNELVRLNVDRIAKDISDHLDTKYTEAADKFLDRAMEDDVVKNMKGIEAIKAAQIAADLARKNKLESEIPPDVATLIPHIVRGLQRRGRDPYAFFYNVMIKLNQIPLPDDESDKTKRKDADTIVDGE